MQLYHLIMQVQKYGYVISVLQNYAPEMMDKDAIEKVIKETLAELSKPMIPHEVYAEIVNHGI